MRVGDWIRTGGFLSRSLTQCIVQFFQQWVTWDVCRDKSSLNPTCLFCICTALSASIRLKWACREQGMTEESSHGSSCSVWACNSQASTGPTCASSVILSMRSGWHASVLQLIRRDRMHFRRRSQGPLWHHSLSALRKYSHVLKCTVCYNKNKVNAHFSHEHRRAFIRFNACLINCRVVHFARNCWAELQLPKI